MKAALASPVAGDERASPVRCGPATGADAPNRYDVPRLCGHLAAAPNQCAGLLAWPNAERGRL